MTEGRPKPMVPVGNRRFSNRVLEAAVEAGVDEVVFVVGHASERIQSYFGDGDDWDVPIRYVAQDHRLGAAHALSQVESDRRRSFSDATRRPARRRDTDRATHRPLD
ncbi:MAG: sugar phosphate nucleotidyltransferase [Halobacteriales archaeon]|nr:sugar phosphate nucleotidyltransferase [Halobacteriales archaeon]